METPRTWDEAAEFTADILKDAGVDSRDFARHALSYDELLRFVKEADATRRAQ